MRSVSKGLSLRASARNFLKHSIIFLALSFGSQSVFANNYIVTQLTENGASDTHQELNNVVTGYVVVNIDNEIYSFDGSTATLLSTSSTNNSNPELNDNGEVVWTGRGGTDAGTDTEVFMYDGTAVTQLTTNDAGESFPRINSSGQVVWYTFGGSDGGTDSEVMFFDGSTTTQVTVNDVNVSSPKISDNGYLVWAEAGGTDGGSDNEIYLYNGTNVIQLTTNTTTDTNAQINAIGEVSWMGQGGSDAGSDFEIFFYDGNTSQLTENSDSEFNPQINDLGQVAWEGAGGTDGGSDDEIFFFNGTSTLQLTANTAGEGPPQISNNGQVVWHATGGSDGGFDAEIFLFNGTHTIQLTSNNNNEIEPKINDLGYVIWRGIGGSDAGADYEIFLAMPDFDEDGIQDSIDTDDDGDNVLDVDDSHPLNANRSLVDGDGDGLVDIVTLAELNAMRFNLTGTGLTLSDGGSTDSRGCFGNAAGASPCNGYELLNDLDFDTNADSIMDANDLYWNNGLGWNPVNLDTLDNYITDSFNAIFEGNYHAILNLFINRPALDGVGLFGAAAETSLLQNIRLKGSLTELTGNQFVGALVGVSAGSLSNCFADAKVNGITAVGGVAGHVRTANTNIYINNCFSQGIINGHTFVGGLVGLTYTDAMVVTGTGIVNNSYSHAAVTASSTTAAANAGGLIGYSNFITTNTYSTGLVIASTPEQGGLIGVFADTSVVDSYWDLTNSGQNMGIGVLGFGATESTEGLTSQELQCPTAPDDTVCKSGSTLFANWDPSLWNFNSNTEYPTLLWALDTDNDGVLNLVDLDDDNDGISDINEAILGTDPLDTDTDDDGLDDGVEDANNNGIIDEGETSPLLADTDGDGANDNTDFYPLISTHIPDADGDGLLDIRSLAELDSIRNNLSGTGLTISSSASPDSRGCFGDASGATPCVGYELLNNLDFDTNSDGVMDANDTYWNGGWGFKPIGNNNQNFSAKFNGNYFSIRNLYINYTSSNSNDENYGFKVGLFVQFSTTAQVENLVLNGSLAQIVGNQSVGALVGSNDGGLIRQCGSTASVNSINAIGGGLIGAQISGSVERSYSNGSVSVGLGVSGGLIGLAPDGSVTDSFTTASVSTSQSKAGGLIGDSRATTTNVFATGAITAGSQVGGLEGASQSSGPEAIIGPNNSSNAFLLPATSTIINSHWDTTTTGQAAVTGFGNPVLTNTLGLTTAEMQCPTGPDDTSCKSGSTLYAGWSTAVWDFNSDLEYPTLIWASDIDSDEVLDVVDNCPSTPNTNQFDIDGDTLGDVCDDDIDGDGVDNGLDAFPNDPSETIDSDMDGVGDNADTDDDNDIMSDEWELYYGFDPLNASDAVLDLDNDGISNLDEYNQGTDPSIANAANQTHTGITRAEIAKPLVLAMYGIDFLPPAESGALFNDVGISDFHADYIEQLSIDGITDGCAATEYCPSNIVTKEQLAVLILKAKFGFDYTPPTASGTLFNDVAISDFNADWIEDLFNKGISTGCDATNFCPNQAVTSEGLGLMLNNAFP